MSPERRTLALGVAALGSLGGLVAAEYAHVWRRGRAPLPAEIDDGSVLEAAAIAARETSEVAVAAARQAAPWENATLNLLGSFVAAFGTARVSTAMIRRRGSFGPFRDVRVGKSHIHHFVPGIVLAFLAGGASVLSRDEEVDRWLAIPFGVGVGLTLDESALLLRLDDVYWTEEGILSVQITLTAIALLAGSALGVRILRRGEQAVLDGPPSAL